MRTQLSELRGELEREKNERMILEKEVMKVMNIHDCHVMIQQSFPDILLMHICFPGRSLEEETERLILFFIILPKVIFSKLWSIRSINY